MMIKNAKSKISSKKESYFVTELESWNTKEKFDVIFSMESLYYSVPMEPALEKVFKLLKKNGIFYCGTDFYSDNTLTTRWVKDMNIPMDLRSEKEWKTMFNEILDLHTRSKHVTDSKNKSNGNVNLEHYLLLAESLDFLITIAAIPIKIGIMINTYQ